MTLGSVTVIFQALNDAGVRYLVVGGLAVVAHGYVRLTADIDLVFAIDESNLRKAVTALESLGYRPRAPVAFSEFPDPARRAAWRRDKGMAVFSAFSPEHPATEIDLFLEPPFDFDDVFTRAARMEFVPGLPVPMIGLEDLISMKEAVGRPQDLEDVRRLRALKAPPEAP